MSSKRSTSVSSARTKNTTKSTPQRSSRLPRLLKTDADYDAALSRIDSLMGRVKPDTAQGDEFELLVKLVEIYEDEHYPIDDPDPIEAIKFRMEQEGLEPADLVPMIGSRSKVSEVLNGKRSLSLNMIRALHERLGIPAEVLIRASAA